MTWAIALLCWALAFVFAMVGWIKLSVVALLFAAAFSLGAWGQ